MQKENQHEIKTAFVIVNKVGIIYKYVIQTPMRKQNTKIKIKTKENRS